MWKFLFVAGIALTAASCGVRREVQMQQDDQECQSIGAVPGSQPYIECRLRMKEMHEARRRAILSAPASTCIRNGNVTNCF